MKKTNYYNTKNRLLNHMGFESDPELLELFIDKLLKKLKIDEFAGCQPISDKYEKVYYLQYVKKEDTSTYINSNTGEILPNGSSISLEVSTKEIEAMYRKFRAVVDLDSMTRSYDVYGEYMKNQYINFMAAEVTWEIQVHLLNLMYSNSISVDYRINLEKDSPITIIHKLQRASNIVAKNSRRGVANKIILTKEVFDKILPFLPNFKEYGSDECDIQFMGDSAIGKIFVSTYSDVVLVHYKGDSSEVDSNIIFSPYSFSNRSVVNPEDFTNLLSSCAIYNLEALSSNYTVSIQVR